MTLLAASRELFGLRIAGFLIGAAVLLWLPFEDVSAAVVLLFAAAINAWWGARLLLATPNDRRALLLRYALVGMLAGLAVTPVALLLMAFKSGAHGHNLPDFSYDQILAVILRTPVWTAAGLLLGLGGALLRLSRMKME
jgi:hypothetical protein